MLYIFLCLIGVTLAVPLDNKNPPPKCGYESCTKHDPNLLNVHIVPHSHDDVGWLKTVDQYFYGSRQDIQAAGVQYILDTVVKELWEDPERRFIYVESFFFFKWWSRQTDAMKEKVRVLVNEGRLQFTGGAWSMNDEAASHYQSTVDQFTHGLSMLNETFGPCGVPRVGWQIDPFGHSREFASLIKAMGFNGLFLGRIDYQDKNNRLQKKNMEMIWRADDDLGKSSDIFTGVLYNTYSPPAGFCFDIHCFDTPFIDDISSPEYNVDRRVSDFTDIIKNMSSGYKTKNVLVTMGEDFHYQDASTWYTNLDKLIKYTNLRAAKENLGIKLFYSTPQCYLKAVKDAKPTLPTKQDDFFPYASDPNSYWTGYFTSRPTTKYFERLTNNYLQMAKQLQVLADLKESNMFVLDELKSAMGIMQHHDAITGTEKQHVAHDYERILHNAIQDSLIIPREAFSKFIQGASQNPPTFSFDVCRLNESSCDVSERSDVFVVTVYNHLAWHVNESVRIPVKDGEYEVYAPNGDKIQSQLLPIPASVINIPTRKSDATHEIVFIAYLKPVFYKNFYVRKLKSDKRQRRDENLNENLLNEYFKSVKDKTDVEIKNLEDISAKKNNDLFIPDKPVVSKEVKNEYTMLNVDVMKDAKNYYKAATEMQRIISEARRLVQQSKNNEDNKKKKEQSVSFNDEEMRMLSDDPMVVQRNDQDFELENEHIKLHFDSDYGEMRLKSKKDGVETKFNVKYGYYVGVIGNNWIAQNRSSGAYIFRPTANVPEDVNVQYSVISKGPVVQEVYVQSDKDISSVIRLYKDLNFIENDWVVGPIDVSDKNGKEYVVNYFTDLITNGVFYTDSNGRQMLKRELGKRPQWNVSIAEPVAGNYYPVTNRISINDDNVKMSILTDRSEGGSSLSEGDIELMLHRRLLHDDAFGVGEALNETVFNMTGLVVRGRHRIVFGTGDKEHNIEEKKLVKQFDLQPQIFVSDAKGITLEDWLKLKNCYSWVNELPLGLHLLTLEPFGHKKMLIRLENYLEIADQNDASVTIDLSTIFKTITLKAFKETALAANIWIEDIDHWTWSTDDLAKDKNDENIRNNGFEIVIKPKQIRTFIVEYDYKK